MLSAAVGSQIAVADVVSEDENDVWLLCLLRGGGRAATVTAATEAIKPSKRRLFTCIFPTPLLAICRVVLSAYQTVSATSVYAKTARI